jgi:hypothetical protein
VLAVIAAASCSKEQPYRKPTFPVRGRVTVDGAAPGAPIQVECHNVQGMDSQHPTISQTDTKPDGSFEIATYESGDGVPEGEYVLTFAWQELPVQQIRTPARKS